MSRWPPRIRPSGGVVGSERASRLGIDSRSSKKGFVSCMYFSYIFSIIQQHSLDLNDMLEGGREKGKGVREERGEETHTPGH